MRPLIRFVSAILIVAFLLGWEDAARAQAIAGGSGQAAILNDRGLARAHYNLAIALNRLNDHAAANQEFSEARRLDSALVPPKEESKP
ncbi:MAG: hypothetical protein WBP79_09610 [Candidatus Acidiferrales bacterium]